MMMTQGRDQSFENCLKCSACNSVCPVALVNENYSGPKQAGPDGERLRLKDKAFWDDALAYCTNCKRCEIACPSNVTIGDIIARAKLQHKQTFSLRNALLSYTDVMGSLSVPFSGLVNPIVGMKPVRKLLDCTLKIDHRRTLPRYASYTFRSWYNKQKQTQLAFSKQIAFFHGCYVNYNFPQLGQDLIRIFNALGIGVQLIDGEKCCGVPLIANGFIKQAKKQAVKNINGLADKITHQGLDVITTSSTCTLTLTQEYQHVLGFDTQAISPYIHLATHYLLNLMQSPDIALELKPVPLKVAYQVPCHMAKLGLHHLTHALIQKIPGLSFVPMLNQCCGISGTYGFKRENHQTSQAIGEPLFEAIENSDIDVVISDCETCKWQIEMSTSKPCLHPITLLAMALT